MAASILAYALLTSLHTATANREIFASKHSSTNWRRNKHAKRGREKKREKERKKKRKKNLKKSDRTASQLTSRKKKM